MPRISQQEKAQFLPQGEAERKHLALLLEGRLAGQVCSYWPHTQMAPPPSGQSHLLLYSPSCQPRSDLISSSYLVSNLDFSDLMVLNSAQRVGFFNIRSGRVLNKIPGSGPGPGRVVELYDQVFPGIFFLSGISGYVGYFRVCRVFLGISGFTHIY